MSAENLLLSILIFNNQHKHIDILMFMLRHTKNLHTQSCGFCDPLGLRIAYLAGKYVPSVYADAAGAQCNGTYHEDDVDALRAFADEPKVVDLFLSYPLSLRENIYFEFF